MGDESHTNSEDEAMSEMGLEEYTWAGETRVRATSMLQGPLVNHGFQKLAQGDETEEVDIGDDDDEQETFGQPQYPLSLKKICMV